ncbi:LCP family protein [Gordonia sp. SL306]|uniref:LCP family protein n=1 Tax=Gordonia sp. SL306 TaxID=2995145 RepID=UPI00226F0CF0|nr:LCP family protein [Gordonia sp. SL306]WAC54852.1 LCP family protein [Gordonia sp. SL306]
MDSRPDGARRRSGGRARPDEPTVASRGPAEGRARRTQHPAQGQPSDPPPRRRRRPDPGDPRAEHRTPTDGRTPTERRTPTDQARPDQPRRRRPPGAVNEQVRRRSGEIHTREDVATDGARRPRRPDDAAPRRRPRPADAPAPSARRDRAEGRPRPPRADERAGAPGQPRRRRPAAAPGDDRWAVEASRAAAAERRRPAGPKPRPEPASESAGTPAAARVKQQFSWRSRTTRTGLGRGLVALLSVAVLLCTGYAWNSVSNLNSNITQLAGLGLGGADDGAVDILLVGTDSRTDAKGNPLSPSELKMLRSGEEVATNTDTILLIRIPNDGSSATAISIPRDSYVDVPGIGMSKINAAYGTTKEGVRGRAVEAGDSEAAAEKEGTQAGRKALIDTVANLTGVKVDHYAEVGLLGFVLLTNAVGGVDVCLNDAVREPFSGARFSAGKQTLNGPKALSFVRQRHGLPRGDLDRITRQQVFMASLTQKMLSAHLLTDPGKLDELQRAVSRSVVIDNNWDILKFAEQLKDLTGGRVKFATIPVVTEQGWSDDGQQSVVQVDPKQVHSFTDNLLSSKKNEDAPDRADYTVDVVNAGTIDGLASNVSNILTTKGFQAGKTGTGASNDKDSVVYAHSDDAGARQLAKDLGGAQVRVDSSMPDKRMKAVLTNTYGGPGSIGDTGAQTDNVPASERVGNNRPPITAGSDGPTCVN